MESFDGGSGEGRGFVRNLRRTMPTPRVRGLRRLTACTAAVSWFGVLAMGQRSYDKFGERRSEATSCRARRARSLGLDFGDLATEQHDDDQCRMIGQSALGANPHTAGSQYGGGIHELPCGIAFAQNGCSASKQPRQDSEAKHGITASGRYYHRALRHFTGVGISTLRHQDVSERNLRAEFGSKRHRKRGHRKTKHFRLGQRSSISKQRFEPLTVSGPYHAIARSTSARHPKWQRSGLAHVPDRGRRYLSVG